MAFLIPHLVDEAAESNPEGQAVGFAKQALTWLKLSHATDQVAATLKSMGVRRGDRVGVMMSKCLEIPLAIYGIMKAGAAYVPLDPTAPFARLQAILDDCDIRHLISEPRQQKAVSRINEHLDSIVGIANIDNKDSVSWAEILEQNDSFSAPRIVESDLAYIIYTSGSTGVPKGIMHCHRSGIVYAKWAFRNYQFDSGDRFTNHAPLHFDMSTFDWFVAAACAGTTIVVPEAHMMMPASYSQLLVDERISVIFTVPFALIQFLQRGALDSRDLSSLKWVIYGGESSATKLIRELMLKWPQAKFSHMYGPAETNGCTFFNIPSPPEGDDPISIGVAFEHMDSLVLDENDQPIKSTGTGELVMRGPTMMLGYWNRPDMNERVFFRHKVSNGIENVYYRTGDIVTVLEDRNLRFVGRKDNQIKIRGYRVELDEVEAAFNAHEAVEEVVAFPASEQSGQIIAVAVLPIKGAEVTSDELLAFVRQRLATYAIPDQLTFVDSFPRTTTGKIDRRMLQ